MRHQPNERLRAAIIAEIRRLAANGQPFPGWGALGRAVGVGATVAMNNVHALERRGQMLVDTQPDALPYPLRRIILADGMATEWGEIRSGRARVAHIAQPAAAPTIASASTALAMRQQQGKAQARARAQSGGPMPRRAVPDIEADAAAIDFAMARSFAPLAHLVDDEQRCGHHSSWMKALAHLVRLGAVCADWARAADGCADGDAGAGA